MDTAPVIADAKNGGRCISFKGQLDAIAVEQLFTLPNSEPGVILEQITISDPTDKPLDTSTFRCGFVKHLREGETWAADAAKIRFCPIPYRRETNGQMQGFALQEVAAHGMSYTGWMEPVVPTPIWAPEGWVWSEEGPGIRDQGSVGSGQWPVGGGQSKSGDANPQSPIPNPLAGRPHPNPLPKGEGTESSPLPKGEGTSAFLIAKHNQQGMEWSLMERLKRGTETQVRFGGASGRHNHPEGATRLEPGRCTDSAKRGFRWSIATGSMPITPMNIMSKLKAAAGRTTTTRRCIGTNSSTGRVFSAASAAYATSTSSSRIPAASARSFSRRTRSSCGITTVSI